MTRRKPTKGPMAEDTVFHNLDGTPDTGADDTGEDFEIAIEGEEDSQKQTAAPDDDTWVPPSDDELSGEPEPPTPGAADPEGDGTTAAPDGDQDLAPMPPTFRKRLERETRAKQRAYENANALAARLAETEEALRVEREERAKATTTQKQTAVSEIDAKIVDARKALRDAIADADVDKQVELNEQLANLMLDRRVAQAQEERAKTAPAAPATRQAPVQPGAPADQNVKQVAGIGVKTPAAEAWANRNAAWLSDPRYAHARQTVLRIDKELYAEGYPMDDPEYFKQLDIRLRRAVRLPVDAPKQRSAVAPGNQSGGTDGRRRISLTKQDAALMRKFKLDPMNKTHVTEYLTTLREERSAQQ